MLWNIEIQLKYESIAHCWAEKKQVHLLDFQCTSLLASLFEFCSLFEERNTGSSSRKESCIWPFGALPNQIWSFDECSPALCTSFFKAYYCMPTCNSRCPKNWNVTKLCLICCISFKPIVVHHPDIDICAKQEGVENLPIHPSLRLHSLKRLARLNERILSPFVTS